MLPDQYVKANIVNAFHLFFRHQFIVIYKTAYYSFYLPVVLALHMVSKFVV